MISSFDVVEAEQVRAVSQQQMRQSCICIPETMAQVSAAIEGTKDTGQCLLASWLTRWAP
eukprot:CAMPEP_0118917444 /NCGR_PEP_ID=MMETSP1166-20130328/17331_1 /TAXON_ID=1104430 /ORGANISM="Chrysoreinhardia sp, Strain CCMP3193" /LENGTH=59 /DNA_ID=CAMNT_0006857619 /DNA_START=39 /DNA_END=214 /DNA_ORIENTATION=-